MGVGFTWLPSVHYSSLDKKKKYNMDESHIHDNRYQLANHTVFVRRSVVISIVIYHPSGTLASR